MTNFFTLKWVAVLAFALLVSCAPEQPEQFGRCYVRAGVYLARGDTAEARALAAAVSPDWPYEGYTDDVFETYNLDPNQECTYEDGVTLEELWAYQDLGYRVVVLYHTGSAWHVEPMISYHENLLIVITGAYVSYYVDI